MKFSWRPRRRQIPCFLSDTVKEEAKILHMMQPDIHAATVSGHDDVIDWSSSDEEDQVISFDLFCGYQPKASRPKGQAVEVAAVDPSDVGEDGQTKLILTSKPKRQDDGLPRCCNSEDEGKSHAEASCFFQ